MSLSNIAVQNAKPASKSFKMHDTGGLYLIVRPSGAKLWRYKYRIDGKENLFALGEYYSDKHAGHISLEAARRARDDARELVRGGTHPSHQRQNALRKQLVQNRNTFQVVAEEWVSRKRSNWSERYERQLTHILNTDVYPTIGTRPIASITAADILEILQKVEARGATTFAHLIRQWVSAIFRYAVATLRAEYDPSSALRGAIMRKKVRHSKALSQTQIRALLERLKSYKGDPGTLFGIRLILLTFVRTIELRAATWQEFDLDGAEWRIPAERMKMREEHIVPLSRQAVALLRELQEQTGSANFLFPNRRRADACITSTTLNRALERMGFLGKGTIGFSAHGFRATASTMLNEAGFRSDIIEGQLAHGDRNQVRASYNRATYMPERRAMMQTWADMVDTISKERLRLEANIT